MDHSLKYAADALGLTTKHLNNLICSGKACTTWVKGQSKIPVWELDTLIRLQEQDSDLYRVWQGGRIRWVNSRLASACLPGVLQEMLIDAYHQGEIAGRHQGNTIELDVQSLEKWFCTTFRSGESFKLTFQGAPLDGRAQQSQSEDAVQ